MIRRSACVYKERIIGVESICTQNNGKIECIPSERKWLKGLSHEKLLFCPCDCGNNLALVAGPIRRPHFKIQETPGAKKCLVVEESAVSVWSRIILKAWFDTKLKSDKIETRVPINRICDSNRKFEYSLYDFENKIGLCYWYDKSNIESIKVDVLERNEDVKRTIYISDIHNTDSKGHDLELMLKVQEKQGYVLYLGLNEEDEYEDAYLIVRILVEIQNGIYKELAVMSDKLDSFNITSNGELTYRDELVSDLAEQCKADEFKRIEENKAKQEEIQRQLEIQREQAEIERQKKQKELQELKEKEEQEKTQQKELADREYAEETERIKLLDFGCQKQRIVDSRRKRWYCCIHCNKKSTTKDFSTYAGRHGMNFGVCYDCEDIEKEAIKKRLAK